MTYRSAEQVKEERVSIMGDQLGSIFDSLYNEIVWIKKKWIEYVALFGTNDKRVKILNSAAPSFFFMMQKIMFDDILLGLSKITDPAGMGKNEAVTVRALSQFISDAKLKSAVLKQVTKITTSTEFCRDWRNRRIAHKDRKLALGHSSATPLKAASRAKVKEAIGEIEKLVHLLEKYYLNTQTAFQFIRNDGGAESLLYLLNNGLKYADNHDKRFSFNRIRT